MHCTILHEILAFEVYHHDTKEYFLNAKYLHGYRN